MAFRFQEVSGNSFAVSKELPNSSCGFITFLISSCYYTLLSYHKTAGKGTAPLPFSIETPRSHSQRKNSLAKAGRESRLEENVPRIWRDGPRWRPPNILKERAPEVRAARPLGTAALPKRRCKGGPVLL